MKKIIIIGSKGMAGNVIYNYFKEKTNFDIVDIARGTDFHKPNYQVDVADFQGLTGILKIEKPAVVINCIGILNADAENNRDKAILLNSYLPHFLARVGDEIGYQLVHISTDCVFNGKKGGYTESSDKDGFGFYAQTKALGEVNDKKHLTLRTSIIGPELKENGIGLFHWFMQQRAITIKGYKEAYWSGVTTLELARAIIAAINQEITGLHHLVNGEKISKYDLIMLFKQIFQKDDVHIEPFYDYKVDKSLVRTNHDFIYPVPSYEEMVNEMKVWIDAHPGLYNFKYTNEKN